MMAKTVFFFKDNFNSPELGHFSWQRREGQKEERAKVLLRGLPNIFLPGTVTAAPLSGDTPSPLLQGRMDGAGVHIAKLAEAPLVNSGLSPFSAMTSLFSGGAGGREASLQSQGCLFVLPSPSSASEASER